MNTKYDREQESVDRKRLTLLSPPPKDCAHEISPDTGTPVMLRSPGDLEWGISSKPVHYGEPVSVLLWLNNSTDRVRSVMTCMNIDYFWTEGIDVFDSVGHRVLSRSEEKMRGKPHVESLFVCTRNFPIEIPAHSCMHGTFSGLTYDFSRDLRSYYELPPGRYYILPKAARADGGAPSQPSPNLLRGVAIDVMEP